MIDWGRFQRYMSNHYTVTALKAMTIGWLILMIILVLIVDNPWFLAGILAYEVLP